ncbi:hypothetical protein GJ633_07310 [Halorubrum sp. CBA1125]|uniref:hypothetical protein n=1 Tax=Halorubrum sp. CBA1125 TaxID=2668072 RepID=UPI0012E8B917|nr:hypothetical protein [Halorubrum sp. CBA1125]MUW14502.1 hypothetical protein [Halorubrum sp. CBA1125]
MQWRFEREGSLRWAAWSFTGFIGTLLCLDVLLLVVPPSDGTAETLRLLLAVGASLTVPLAVILGVVYRPVYAVGGLLAVPLVAVYVVSGLLLPWDQVAFDTGQQVLDALLAVPVLGDRLTTVFFGGPALSQRSLRLAFRYHYAIVGVGVVGLAVALGAGVRGHDTISESTA